MYLREGQDAKYYLILTFRGESQELKTDCKPTMLKAELTHWKGLQYTKKLTKASMLL
jgi:hypothetical protein